MEYLVRLLYNGMPQSGQSLSGKSNPEPTEPSLKNSDCLQFGQT